MERVIKKESHLQQIELLKEENRINENKYAYLKEMERKLKALIVDWRKAEDKNKVVKMMQAVLFKQPEKQIRKKKQRKIDSKYIEVEEEIKEGSKVLMTANQQVGNVIDIRGKKAVVQVGTIPITVNMSDLVVVREREEEE